VQEESKKEESSAVKEARAKLAALRAKSNKLSSEQEQLAEIAGEILAQQRRLDKEGEESLRQRAWLEEQAAWERIPDAQRPTASVACIYDYPTDKRTGRGIIVVTALDRNAAISAMKPANKIGEGGLALYDTSHDGVVKGLCKAALYPAIEDVQLICEESPAFAQAAYSQAVQLAGAFAKVAAGKYES